MKRKWEKITNAPSKTDSSEDRWVAQWYLIPYDEYNKDCNVYILKKGRKYILYDQNSEGKEYTVLTTRTLKAAKTAYMLLFGEI